MQLIESSIFVNMKQLREKLYAAQFGMEKANRVIYGTPLMNEIGKALGSYIVAFINHDDKIRNIDSCIAWFTMLRVDLEFCVKHNIIHFKKRTCKDANGNKIEPDDPRDAVNSEKIEIFRLVGSIDNDMCKWRASLAKGKTLHE